MSTSTELRIPTQTFLLPGQEFCIGLPWDRAELPKHGRIAEAKSPLARLTLRGDGAKADPFEGFELGSCTVLRRLSDGGAKTLLAVRREEGVTPALVVMRRLELPEVLARDVRNHAEWAGHFTHPALVQVFPCETSEEGVFWVTELASGATLTELTVAMKKNGQSVPLGLALGAVLDVARALGELHSHGAAHGLVSDQSVAIGFDGSARLHDTGLFRCMGQGASWLELREAMAAFFAPEQLLEGRLPDPKADVYSLGAVLYECLTGEKVRKAKSFDQHFKLASEGHFIPASRLNVTVNAQLDEVISRALSADRSKRYANGREFALALSEAAAAFTWRKELRAQFVARHFEPRRKEEESLRAQLPKLDPMPVRAPTPMPTPDASAALGPSPRLQGEGVTAAPPPRVQLFEAVAPSRKRKKNVPPPKRRWPVLAAFVVGLAGVAGVMVLPELLAPPPAPPKPPLVWLDDAQTETVSVAFEQPTSSRAEAEATYEPELLAVPESVATAQAKPMKAIASAKKKRTSRKNDDAPVPPWLMAKKSRRR
ncbi:MAG: protein kinase [Archangium sp.]